MKPPLIRNARTERASVVTANETTEASLTDPRGRHRPEEPDNGCSGAQRPKQEGRLWHRSGVGEQSETLDLGATRYRDFLRSGREGQEQITSKTKSVYYRQSEVEKV